MGQAVLYEDFLATLSAPNLALARGSATAHAKDFLRMHPFSRDHRLTDADMRYGARCSLILLPTNDMFVVPSVQQSSVGGEEVRKDGFTKFRARFRECHAWPRHNNLTTLFIKILRSLRFSVLPSNRVFARIGIVFLWFCFAERKRACALPTSVSSTIFFPSFF